jgi:hypothetical protein
MYLSTASPSPGRSPRAAASAGSPRAAAAGRRARRQRKAQDHGQETGVRQSSRPTRTRTPAGFRIVFTGSPVISLGVHRRVYSRRCLRVLPLPRGPLSMGEGNGRPIGWLGGPAGGSRTRLNGLLIPLTVPGSCPGHRAGGPPRPRRAVRGPGRRVLAVSRPARGRRAVPVGCHAFAVPVEPPPACPPRTPRAGRRGVGSRVRRRGRRPAAGPRPRGAAVAARRQPGWTRQAGRGARRG